MALGGGGFSKTLLVPNQYHKIDKNMIRNSSPAKTNLERLNTAQRTGESQGNSFIGPSGFLNQVNPVHNIKVGVSN